ncbi:MAG: hypothetical protein AB8G86_20780 [Saprospiraceae bacterium]
MDGLNNDWRKINWISTIGITLFFGLYGYATTLYPGGSQLDAYAVGFDWINNYWCDLLGEKGTNGQPNPARPIAILAMAILCLSLVHFFWQFANTFAASKLWTKLIKICGAISMFFSLLIFTEYHDFMIILASLFGLPLVLGIIKGIYQSKLTIFKITGLIGLLPLSANNYIYYTNRLLEWLPLLQKISFLIILGWIISLSIKISQ